MKAIYEFKTECHEQGKQQKKSSGYTESLSEYFHNWVRALNAPRKDQLQTREATDATLQFRHIERFEPYERFDFRPVHTLNSSLNGL